MRWVSICMYLLLHLNEHTHKIYLCMCAHVYKGISHFESISSRTEQQITVSRIIFITQLRNFKLLLPIASII